jgi:hypothetical protein
MTLNRPWVNSTIPIITTRAPVTLLIHNIVFIVNLFLKWPNPHDSRNQYTTEPPATESRIGATRHVLGESSVMPKKAKQDIGRNDPCPCGSGKKYKNCCGQGK